MSNYDANILDVISKTCKKNIEIKDLIIYDDSLKEKIGNSFDQCYYNLGDILNMPGLVGIWPRTPHRSGYQLKKMQIIANALPDSILNLYCEKRPPNEIMPNIPRLINAVHNYTINNYNTYETIYNIIKNPNVLCVHVRSGDKSVDNDYINCIETLSKKYSYVILLAGIHGDEHYKSDEQKKIMFQNDLNTILNKNNNIYLYLNNADISLSLMRCASNLLIHRGGFSAIGFIVSTGNLFITKLFGHIKSEVWLSEINKKYTLV